MSATIVENKTTNLGKQYVWERGDTMALIAAKYRRPNQYAELIDHNKATLHKNNHLMRAGDIIQIPESWFPLPSVEYSTNFIGSKGVRT